MMIKESCISNTVLNDLVVLSDSFWGMMARRNSAETQQSGHAQRSEPEVKNGISSAKDGAPKRLRRGSIQKEMG